MSQAFSIDKRERAMVRLATGETVRQVVAAWRVTIVNALCKTRQKWANQTA